MHAAPPRTLLIAGSTGRMGRFLTRRLTEAGHLVRGADLPFAAQDLATACAGIDLALLCVPAAHTEAVIETLLPHLPAAAILADIVSVKEHPLAQMEALWPGPVVGTHPLFGPAPALDMELPVAVVPGARADEAAVRLVEALFVSMGCTTFRCTASEHDKAMAWIQGMNFISNVGYFAMIAEEEWLRPYLTPSFRRRLDAARKMLTEDGELFTGLFEANPHSHHAVRHYRRVLRAAAGGDVDLLLQRARWWWRKPSSLSCRLDSPVDPEHEAYFAPAPSTYNKDAAMPNVRSVQTDKIRFFGDCSPLELIAAYGSPLYVYSERVLRERCRELVRLSSHPGFRVNYSAKANTNPALLRIIREEGCLVDAMSPGELHLNRMAGFLNEEILYVCNNVSGEEMRHAVENGLLVSVDSLSQLDLYGRINPGGRVMIRINPGIGAGHHKKVVTAGKETKFGIDPEAMSEVRNLLALHRLHLTGINQHIGSLFMDPEGYLAAMDMMLGFAEQLLGSEGFGEVEVLDFGGGFGIPYKKYEDQPRLDMAALGARLDEKIRAWADRTGYNGRFLVEPGRYVVAECGVLLGTVYATKFNGAVRYAGTDLGFNVLMRPALYDAFHDIEVYRGGGEPDLELVPQTVVGNICESGDILAKNRLLPLIRENDILGVLDAGAYGFVMASSYNQRPRPAEVLIGLDGQARLIRRRETLEDLAAMYCL